MLTRAPLRDAGGYSPMTAGPLEGSGPQGQVIATLKYSYRARAESQVRALCAAATPEAIEA